MSPPTFVERVAQRSAPVLASADAHVVVSSARGGLVQTLGQAGHGREHGRALLLQGRGVHRCCTHAMTRTSFADRYGPWAVVLGASEGLGAAYADGLAARGLNILVAARRHDELQTVADSAQARYGIEARAVVLDLASKGFLDELRRHTDDLQIGMVVYNGAAGYVGPMREQPATSLDAIVAVNCSGPLAVCHHFGVRMLERGRGGLVLMGSAAGLAGAAHNSAYSASKAFAIVLGEALWAEWHSQGVDVISVIGPAIDTPNYRAALDAGMDHLPDAIAPSVVVDETLEALGTTPSFVPGQRVREMLAMLGTLPRQQQVEALSAAHARFTDRHHEV